MDTDRIRTLEGNAVDVEKFIAGMRDVPTVVTVVTMADEDGNWGITIGSFVSLSLEPPLICFNVQKSIEIHDPLINAEHFVVHVLRENQSHYSDLFARSDISRDEQFAGLDFTPDQNGTPVLGDALVTFYCRSQSILPGGDHSILVGLVENVSNGNPGRPVVYHQRAYYGIGKHIADHH